MSPPRSAAPHIPHSILMWSLLALAALGTVAQLTIVSLTNWPLGVEGEWTWARVGDAVEIWNLWPALLTGSGLAAYGLIFKPRPATAPRQWTWRLLGLWLIGGVWILSLVSATPGIAGLSRAPFVLFYSRSSGYFTQAMEIRSLPEFWATYRDRIEDSNEPENYLHLGTHPPGLTTLLYLLREVCESSPEIAGWIESTQPASVVDAFHAIPGDPARGGVRLSVGDGAALWLATVLVAFSAAGACVPIALLSQRAASRAAAWTAACAWLLIPALAVFLPKSDVAFPLISSWMIWMWLHARDRASIKWAFAAGLVSAMALCMSLAFLPIGLMLLLQMLLPFCALRLRVRLLLAGAMGVCVVVVLAAALGQANLLSIWAKNLQNHAAFYAHHTRSYGAWLAVTPAEWTFTLGAPLAVAALWGWVRAFHRDGATRADVLIPMFVWAGLWLSGKNMGESARLWGLLLPMAVWAASLTIDDFQKRKNGSALTLAWLVLQLITCAGVTLCVDGFHFSELLKPIGPP